MNREAAIDAPNTIPPIKARENVTQESHPKNERSVPVSEDMVPDLAATLKGSSSALTSIGI
jgi:hypothetical protein